MAKTGEVHLGDLVRDDVTKFQGVCVVISEWLNGCRRIGIQSDAMKDGVPVDPYSVDENQITVLAGTTHRPKRETGGPQNDRAALRRN